MAKASEVVVDPCSWLDTPLAVPAPRGGGLQIRLFRLDLLVECNSPVSLIRNLTGSTSGALKNLENYTCFKLTNSYPLKTHFNKKKVGWINQSESRFWT